MKKLVVLMLALVMALSVSAFAEPEHKTIGFYADNVCFMPLRPTSSLRCPSATRSQLTIDVKTGTGSRPSSSTPCRISSPPV